MDWRLSSLRLRVPMRTSNIRPQMSMRYLATFTLGIGEGTRSGYRHPPDYGYGADISGRAAYNGGKRLNQRHNDYMPTAILKLMRYLQTWKVRKPIYNLKSTIYLRCVVSTVFNFDLGNTARLHDYCVYILTQFDMRKMLCICYGNI